MKMPGSKEGKLTYTLLTAVLMGKKNERKKNDRKRNKRKKKRQRRATFRWLKDRQEASRFTELEKD